MDIYTYITENTFDSYLYQLLESKQKFIGQIMTDKSPVRSAEDIDEIALSYAEIKALCSGDPRIKEKLDLEMDVRQLNLLKANFLSQRYDLEDQIIKDFPQRIAALKQLAEGYAADGNRLKENTHPNQNGFSPMEVLGTVYTDKKAAGTAILAACKTVTGTDAVPLGQYRGFSMELSFDSFYNAHQVTLKGTLSHTVNLGTNVFGNIQRMDHLLDSLEKELISYQKRLENAKKEVEKPFPQEKELKEKTARLDKLNIELNLDKRESEVIDEDKGDDMEQSPPARDERER